MHEGLISEPTFSFSRLEAVLDCLEAEASANDPAAAFPGEGMATLARLGVTALPLPRSSGGQGWGPRQGANRPCCICCA
ncbi:hypothetical protein [Gluconacetobacter diazotrophicus]|nr:hypothetical protein [Gluconacetobacter diazotrophicus]